jgi:predicted SnoaL-like aldol condensation-catalyzing enzyme
MWNTGDRTEADAVLGPTYLDHAHASVVGPAAVRSLVRRFRAENPEAQMVVEIVAFDSEYVIVRRAIRWSARGAIEACGVALFRVARGQLAEQWSWPAREEPEARVSEGLVALGYYF